MIIGLPKETKDGEMRVALTPDAVRNLTSQGHTVRVQMSAGVGAGFSDTEYIRAGATLAPTAAHAYDADLVVKVKEIQAGEWQHLRRSGMLFSFLHLGADHVMARELLDRRITGIAFETVADRHGKLPILAPMSEIAGELAIPIAANLLMKPNGGKGIMMRGARVLVIGAGVAGRAAARTAADAGAQVRVVVRNLATTTDFDGNTASKIQLIEGDAKKIATFARDADVIIGAVNSRGQATPKLLTRDDIKAMRPGSVLIEICIDGGGISETSRPTYHAAPTYIDEGITHYCVANMPAAVPRSASIKISSAILPYIRAIANDGLLKAMRDNDGFTDGLKNGLQMHDGRVTHAGIAAELRLPFFDLDAVLFSC
jgi:alanine dehydrogenase